MLHREQNKDNTIPHSDDKRVVKIRILQKSFNEKQVLKDVSFDLYEGENLVVLGRSGTGKSVTIKCMVGLFRADA